MSEVTEEKRVTYLNACPAFGIDEKGGAGYDSGLVECQICKKEAPEMAADCKAETLPDGQPPTTEEAPEPVAVDEPGDDSPAVIEDDFVPDLPADDSPPEEADETAATTPADTTKPKAKPKAEKKGQPRERKWDKICTSHSRAGFVLALLKEGQHTMAEVVTAFRVKYPQFPSDKQAQSWINGRVQNWVRRGYFTVEGDVRGKLQAVPPSVSGTPTE